MSARRHLQPGAGVHGKVHPALFFAFIHNSVTGVSTLPQDIKISHIARCSAHATCCMCVDVRLRISGRTLREERGGL